MVSGNIYQPLQPLQRIKQSPLGGFCFIELVPVEWVASVPEVNPKYNTITSKVTLQSGKDWLIFSTVDGTRGYTENIRSSDAGDFIETTVNAFVPLNSVKNEVQYKSMRYLRYLIIVNLANGIRKLLGSLENPVRFTRSFTSADSSEGNPGNNIQFTWTSADYPQVYMQRPNNHVIFESVLNIALGTGTGDVVGDGDGSAVGDE